MNSTVSYTRPDGQSASGYLVQPKETSSAPAIWYGYPPLEYVDASKIKAPLMGSFAIYDDVFPIAGVDALEKKLTDARVKYSFDRYEAKHAFANEEADTKNLAYLKYDHEATLKAWDRTIDFLRRNLS
jgi:carboxymethylenebutenolidase